MKKHQLVAMFREQHCACVYTLNHYHAIREEHIDGKTVKDGARSVIIVSRDMLDDMLANATRPYSALDEVAVKVRDMLGRALSRNAGEPFDTTQRYEVVSGEIERAEYISVEQLQGLVVGRRKLLHGEWLGPTPEQEREAEIAEQYHESCDAYDKQVCSGTSPRTGEPMPITPKERGLVSRHAVEVRRGLIAMYNLTDAEFHRIITKGPIK